MEEGYYLSTFLTYGELQNIYNIKLRHDQAIALWKYEKESINLIRYWELERISGYKEHPITIFNKTKVMRLISKLLEQEGIRVSDLKGIWGTKGIETEKKYMEQFQNGICFHNIAHLLTAIYYNNDNPFNSKIIGLSMDAGPDSQFEEDAYQKKYYSGCVINEGNIEIFNIQSPARLWSYTRKRFKIKEGTLMALATATDTEYYGDISEFENFDKYKLIDETSREYSEKIVEEVIDRIFSLKKEDIGKKCSKFDNKFSDEENKISMVMKIIEKMSEIIVSKNIEFIIKKYNINTEEYTLAMAGGFTLNCPTNSYILEKYKFKNYQIPPCTSDTGIAMGVGIAAFFGILQSGKTKLSIDKAYYGMECGKIENINEKYNKYIKIIKKVTYKEIVEDIIKNKIIIWVNENAEIGPRALGNRSLLGDPRYLETKNLLNIIKKRQWWRPVAPIVIDEEGNNYFKNYRYSPYMLLNLKIKKDKKELVPAIIHLDDTARIQSLKRKDNPNLYKLMQEFYNETSIPILCNTSLNDAGEPIINNIEEAIEFALHKGIQSIYVNGQYKIILKLDVELQGKKFNYREEEDFLPEEDLDIEKYKLEKNPFSLTEDELTYFFDNPNKFKGLNITIKEDTDKIKKETKEYIEKYKNALMR